MSNDCPVTFTIDDFDSEELYSLVDIIDAGSGVLIDKLYNILDLGIFLRDGMEGRKELEQKISRYEEIWTKAVFWIADLAGAKEKG